MKSLSFVVLSFAVLSAATAAPDKRTDDSQLAVNADCFWSGTAPFCAGSCEGSPTVECATSSCGDGACCWTGYKKYCCYGGSCPS
ncbi:hypothetical protein EDB19DRAFT_1103603 [Suillus lakei]|nr:hypothetical protein EDB19DRAFT_1103603 [Suillus lakei]